MKLFRAAFDDSGGAALLVDTQRRLVDVNLAGAQLFGRQRDALVGEMVDAHLHGVPSFVGTNLAAVEDDGVFRLVEVAARRVGRRRTLVHVRDLVADEEDDAWTHTVHDLSNALAVVTAFGGAISARRELSQEARVEVSHVLAAAAHAIRLTRDVSANRRGEAASYAIVDLGVVVRAVQTLLVGVLGDAIDLDVRVNAPHARVLADVLQIERLLVNLAVNAREAMPAGGTFQVETRNTRGVAHVELVITDTGSGMDERTAMRALDVGFSTKQRSGGSGLAIVAKIVKRHFGVMRFTSIVGQGTSFEIRLPLSHDPTRRS